MDSIPMYGVATYSATLLCTHIYNTRQDVEAAIAGVRDLMRA